MSYKKLKIWELARAIVIDVHEMTLKLPGLNYSKRDLKSENPAKQPKLQLLKVMAEGDINRTGLNF